MNGVTILNSTEVVAKTTHIWDTKCTISLCIMIAGLLISLGILWVSGKWSEQRFNAVLLIGSTLFILGLVFTILFYKTENSVSYKIQYQVIVDDSVSLNEFLENYNIINIDSKIYTVEEKN